jgi:sulfate transport system ATP-binding protein
MSISVLNVTKRYGNFLALDNVSLEVPEGTLLALLGPSGSGKTTLLRVIAGLEFADSGSVHSSDNDVTRQSARDRNMGFVFQHYALFRHMTVFENIAFALRVRNWKNGAVEQRVRELLHLVRLDGLENRYPSQLSGGQRQRVALARSLAAQPLVLLLDEPFGALDAKVRKELRQWLRRLHDDLGVTSVFVTHDQEEAFEVADQVVVMGQGRIQQAGTPLEIFEHPANPFVMDFLGQVNVFHGRVQDGKAMLGNLELDYPGYHYPESRPATVYVRPHELDIDRVPGETASLEGRVEHVNPVGSVARVEVSVPGFGLSINVDLAPARLNELRLRRGDTVYVSPRRVRVFMPEADFSI